MGNMKEKLQTRDRAFPQWEVREETALTTVNDEKTSPVPDEAARARFGQLVARYKKRQRDTLIDTVSTGLSYGSDVAVDLGLMEDTGLLTEITDTVGTAFPFAVIAVTEQAKVIMGKKTQKAAMENTVYRMVKTGAALGVGALAATVGGVAAAIPAAVGVRVMMDHYKSKALLGSRIAGRTARLRDLTEKRRQRVPGIDEADGTERLEAGDE